MQRESIAFCAIGMSIRKRFYDAIVERMNPRNAERRSIGSKISKSPEYKSRQSPSETFVDAAENRFDERGSSCLAHAGATWRYFARLTDGAVRPISRKEKGRKRDGGINEIRRETRDINVPRYRGKAANVATTNVSYVGH